MDEGNLKVFCGKHGQVYELFLYYNYYIFCLFNPLIIWKFLLMVLLYSKWTSAFRFTSKWKEYEGFIVRSFSFPTSLKPLLGNEPTGSHMKETKSKNLHLRELLCKPANLNLFLPCYHLRKRLRIFNWEDTRFQRNFSR